LRVWTGFDWLWILSNAGSFGHGNETADFIKGGEYPDQMMNYQHGAVLLIFV
jgi:hypothetical protein